MLYITVTSTRITDSQLGSDDVTNQAALEITWMDFVTFVMIGIKIKMEITSRAQLPSIVVFEYTSV